MASFGDLVQKAFYLGVGVASYAGEKAGGALGELRSQAQKIADEMVARGEMTTEEAKKLVDEMVNRAQQSQQDAPPESDRSGQPRRIEILSDDDASSSKPDPADDLRQQVTKLQEELRRLKRD
jgi:polyhydroxyalkanoate synthesis regulator phasin